MLRHWDALPRRGRTRIEFERFVDTCAGELLRTGYLIVWDLEEAEDLVQETLLRVARRWPRVRRMDQPVAYARRILVNLAIDDAKRRSAAKSYPEPNKALLNPPDRPGGCETASSASRRVGERRPWHVTACRLLCPRPGSSYRIRNPVRVSRGAAAT